MRRENTLGWAVATGAGALVSGLHLAAGFTLASPHMVVQPWLLRHGFAPYLHIADQKMPLLPQALAWLSVLWQGDALRTMLFAQGIVMFVLVCLSVRWTIRQGGMSAGFVAALFYLAWSGTFGFWALYYDLVLGLIYLLLFLLLARPPGDQSYLSLALCGLLAAAAVLVKQHAVFLIFPLVYWLYCQVRYGHGLSATTVRLAAAFVGGFALFAGASLLYLYAQASTWSEFVYWTFTYNLTQDYASQGKLAPPATESWQLLPAFLLATAFAIGHFAKPKSEARLSRRDALWLVIFAAIALVPLYPRYSQRHLATVAPFIAMMSGLAFTEAMRSAGAPSAWTHARRLFAGTVVVLWVIAAGQTLAVRLAPSTERVFGEYSNLLPLAAEIDARLPDDAEIVLFPEDEAVANLYYLLDRPPPPYWLMHYPWMLTARSVPRWLDAVQAADPDFVIYFPARGDPTADEALRTYVIDNYAPMEELRWQDQPVELRARRDAEKEAPSAER